MSSCRRLVAVQLHITLACALLVACGSSAPRQDAGEDSRSAIDDASEGATGADSIVADTSEAAAAHPDAATCEPGPLQGTGALAWVQRSTGDGSQPLGLAVTTSGALVVGGKHNGSIMLAPDSGAPVSFSVKGQYDLWLARWQNDGILTWARAAGTSVQSMVSAVAPAPGDDAYVGGTAFAYPNDPLVLGAGETNQTTFTRYGTFFARYRADGSLVWAKVQQNGGNPYRILPAPDGGFFAVGDAGSFAAVFGVGESHQTALIPRTVSSSTPTFVARFGADGQLTWVRTLGGIDPDAVQMADGGVAVVGMCSGDKAVFEGGKAPDATLVPDWGDLFITSYSSAGDLRWVKAVTGPPQVMPEAVTVLSSGDIIIAASCEPKNKDSGPPENQAIFAPGEANETRISCTDFDLVYARFAPDGRLVWAKSIPSLYPGLRGLAPLADGGFAMASTFRKTDPAIFEAASCSSLSLSRLSQTTDLVMSWHRPDGRVRNARILATGSPRIIGLSALNDGSVALTGAFSATTTFGPLDITKVSYAAVGGENTFLARITP